MAPEIHLEKEYDGPKVDLFSAAIILFVLVSGHPPFTTAEPKDPFYRCLAAGKADIFWKQHSKGKDGGEGFFSNDFKDLITIMLSLDPEKRPSIEELISHAWMQGEHQLKKK